MSHKSLLFALLTVVPLFVKFRYKMIMPSAPVSTVFNLVSFTFLLLFSLTLLHGVQSTTTTTAIDFDITKTNVQIELPNQVSRFVSKTRPESISNVTFASVVFDDPSHTDLLSLTLGAKNGTQKVFIGAKNFVHRISVEKGPNSKRYLQLEDTSKRLAFRNKSGCPTIAAAQVGLPTEPVNNDFKVIFTMSSKAVFACGPDNCGRCEIFKPWDLSSSQPFGSSEDNIPDFIGGRKSALVFSGVYRTGKMFYVAVEPDGREVDKMPPFFSARSINNKNFVYTTRSNNYGSKASFYRDYINNYQMKMMYGFQHNGYAYVLTLQPDSLNNDTALLETRLGRVCSQDDNFNSYMELPLVCRTGPENAPTEHLVAQTAALTQNINSLLVSRISYSLNENSKEASLYIAFESSSDKHNQKSSPVCQFDMNLIEERFIATATNCNYNGDRAELLGSMRGPRDRKCGSGNFNPTENEISCGSTYLNRFILSKDPLAGKHVFTLKNDIITSIGAVSHNFKTNLKRSTNNFEAIDNLILGTEKSRLLQVELKDHEYNAIRFYSQRDPKLGSFMPNPAFDPDTGNFYVLTSRSLTEVATFRCSMFTSCAACFRSENSCFWIDGQCKHQNNVEPMLRELECSPEVYSFDPKEGPVQGGTVITLHGFNLGNNSANPRDTSEIYVNVGKRACKPLERNHNLVTCRIEDSDKLDWDDGVITVNASDFRAIDNLKKLGYNINGTVTLSAKFTFRNASIKGIHPMFGPIIGGTRVTVFGEHLDIGSNATVMIDTSYCPVVARSRAYVICQTPLLTNSNSSEPQSKQIKVSLDSHNMVINGDESFKLDSSTVFNPEYDADPVKIQPFKRKRQDFRGVQHPFGRSIELYIDLLRHINEPLNFSESFQYLPNPQVTNIYDRSEKLRHTKSSDDFHTIASGQTELIFEGYNLNSVIYPMLDVGLILDKTLKNMTSVLCKNVSKTNISCLIPALPKEVQPSSSRSIKARYILHMDGAQVDGDNPQASNSKLKLPRSNIVYHSDPVFTQFNQTIKVSTKEMTIELHGKYLHHDLPYVIKLNDTLDCMVRDEGNSLNLLRCKLDIEPDMITHIYGEKIELTVFLGNNIARIGNVMLHDEVALSAVSIVFIIIGSLLVVLVIVGLAYMRYQHIQQNASVKNYNWTELNQAHTPKTLEDFFNDAYQNLDLFNDLNAIGKIISDPTEVQKLEISLGSGNFGIVIRGKYRSGDVAIKTLKRKANLDLQSQLHVFFTEAKTMKDFENPNVLSLIGVTLVDESPAILLPFMSYGDLAKYVQSPLHNPSVRDLLNYSIQVARGMTYLAAKKYVHRDLAARNCLIGLINGEVNVKVADFGLSRQFEGKLYYRCTQNKELPFKWMPLETLEGNNIVTSKSDVWSYGVLVWELITRGQIPYGPLEYSQVTNLLRSGRRLQQPSHCPDLIFMIMSQCWYDDPEERPDFQDVLTMMEDAFRLLHLQESNTYVNMDEQRITFRPNPFDYTNADIKTQVIQAQEQIYQKNFNIHPVLPRSIVRPVSELYDDDLDEDDVSQYPYAPPSYTAATALPSTSVVNTSAPTTSDNYNQEQETHFGLNPPTLANGHVGSADYSTFSNTATLPR